MPRILILSNPRSGSTLLMDLLNSHPEIKIESELLNDEIQIEDDPFTHLENQLSLNSETFTGFKVFPEQLFERGINFTELVNKIGVTQIIVLWREGLLETLASRRIAEKTGIWYSENNNFDVQNGLKNSNSIKIDPIDLTNYIKETKNDWDKITDQWPISITPIFIKFEDLITNQIKEVRGILSQISCPIDNFITTCPSIRQNPAAVEKKIKNFNQLPKEIREAVLDVKKIFSLKGINESALINLDEETLIFAPDKEPIMPTSGWIYRVAEPFITDIVKQNVYDAIDSWSISSAGYWPRLMAFKLKQLFQLPIAQPCSNGFTALMLAMQCAGIGEGDEVIMPSMTMVAVPNAAHFIKARPVFADCSEDNFNPGLKEILKVSNEKTKAIVVTHTYGVPSPDMEDILEECEKRGWWLIEDISEAVGVTTQLKNGSSMLLGTFGHFACASLYVNKMIHAGDGGFILAKNPNFGKRLTSLVNHGFTPSYHFVHFEPALNAKINGLGAAIACGCIDAISQVIGHRSHVAKKYREALKSLPIKLMPQCGPQDTPWVFGLVCECKEQRTKLRSHLAKCGIETRDFFFALHLQPAYYKNLPEHKPQTFLKLSEILGSTGFYLPTHSNLQDSDIDYITSCFKIFFQKKNCILPEIPVPPVRKLQQSLQISPGAFQVNVRTFNDSGSLKHVESRSHLYYTAIGLGIDAEEAIISDRWDTQPYF